MNTTANPQMVYVATNPSWENPRVFESEKAMEENFNGYTSLWYGPEYYIESKQGVYKAVRASSGHKILIAFTYRVPVYKEAK